MSQSLLQRRWQRLPEKAIKELQAIQLRRYLRTVVLPFSAHYRELFRQHGITSDSIHTLDDWRRVPFTTKNDLCGTGTSGERIREFIIMPDARKLARRPSTIVRGLLRGRASARRALESEFRPLMLTATTGRSAERVPFLYTRHDLRNLATAGCRMMQVADAESDFRMVNLFPYAPHLAFWQAHYAGTAFGVFMVSSGGGKVMGTEGNIQLIRKTDPHVLIGMPTFVYHVLHEAAEEGQRFSNLRRIVLGGEKAPVGMRRKLRELAAQLGSPAVAVLATYGFTESKMAWSECPFPRDAEPSGYHLSPDLGFVEIVDPESGGPVPDGEPGEIVFTPLDARGTVVMRYRTGDLIDGGLTYEPCPHCGRSMPRLMGRISRQSQVTEMRFDKIKGTLVDFNQLEHVVEDVPHIGSWQLELRKVHDDPLDLDELVLHVCKTGDVDDARLIHDLNHRFMEQTELRPNRIEFHSPEEMRSLQGVGTQLKEEKIVDHRPRTALPSKPSREHARQGLEAAEAAR